MKKIGLSGYIFASFLVHLFSGYLINNITIPKSTQEIPIKVKISTMNPKDIADLMGMIIDIPKPKNIEKPLKKMLLSMFDSRRHSNMADKKSTIYRDIKSIIPQKKLPPPSSKHKPLKSETRKEEERFSEKPEKLPHKVRSLSLIDGIDNKEYPRMDSEKEDESSDEELISLDTQEFKYVDYFTSIRKQIEEVWLYPVKAMKKGISGKVLLRFTISKEGKLVDVQVLNTSGYKILDDAAIKAFKIASPYKPIPDTLNKNKLNIIATLSYMASFSVLR